MQSSDRFKIGFGGDLAAQADFVRFRCHFGPILGPSWGSSWGHFGAMLTKEHIFGGLGRRSKTKCNIDPWRAFFKSDFGTIFEPKMVPESDPKRIQERSSEKC